MWPVLAGPHAALLQGAHARPGRSAHAPTGPLDYRAIAPSAALPTSFAYLAIATSTGPLAGGV